MDETLSFLLVFAGACSLGSCLPLQYHLVTSGRSWWEARAYCRGRHTDLATLFQVEDANRLVNSAQASAAGFRQKAWIGLWDNSSSWRWSGAGPLGDSYRNWAAGQPDNFLGEQMCAKVWSGGRWDDSRCFLKNSFVCSAPGGFVFVGQEMSWARARAHCRGRYLDLATVRNRQDNERVRRLSDNRPVWIGLFRTRVWSDGSGSTYRYWKGGEPDNRGGRESCVAADLGNAGRWSDEACGRSLAFVCYGPKRTVSSSETTTTTSQPLANTAVPEETSSSEHVMRLRVRLSSSRALSEHEMSEQFYSLLVDLGLPPSIKVGVKKPET